MSWVKRLVRWLDDLFCEALEDQSKAVGRGHNPVSG
jgi:hypothetical protein